MLKVFAFSIVLSAAAPALAQSAPVDGAPTQAKPAKEKKLCRSETPTGSMMAKSVCHTKSEWAAIDQANGRNATDFSNSLSHGAGSSRGI